MEVKSGIGMEKEEIITSCTLREKHAGVLLLGDRAA